MQKEERRRKFHEALIEILYPPPSSPAHQGGNVEQCLNTNLDGLDVEHVPDELGEVGSSSSSSGDDDRERGPQKSTRAQRKRLRKKKLKEDSLRRAGMIGPLLPAPDPSSTGGDGGDSRDIPQGVRRNAAEELDIVKAYRGEPGPAPCTNQNKVKYRRKAKKLAKERLNSSDTERFHQDCSSSRDS